MKLESGISNFVLMMQDDHYYADRTQYIERLENEAGRYLVFLRPRRFGKSLFISMLEHYYGVNHQEQFDELFGKTYIGQHPTSEANSYKILKFDFSGIETSTEAKTMSGFRMKVLAGVHGFLASYSDLPKEMEDEICDQESPADMIGLLFESFRKDSIYLLVDEYDGAASRHFANDIIAFNFDKFLQYVGQDGFVQKFYEVIKTAVGENTVSRLFITGVTPITLDSLTSGFNIVTNMTTDPRFNEMLGFTEEETSQFIGMLDLKKSSESLTVADLMKDMKLWYNGYRFHPDVKEKVYNPEMVLNFARVFSQQYKYPSSMIADNVASDYGKIRRMFEIKNPEQNYEVLEQLIGEGAVSSQLTTQFSFEKGFSEQDFISLLFYLGFISMEGSDWDEIVFSIPNHVIQRLYWDYFISLVQQRLDLEIRTKDVRQCIKQMAQENQVRPFVELIGSALKSPSNRNAVEFDEKYVKALFVGYANLTDLYFIRSEREVDKKYPDVMLLFRKPNRPNFQFIFELKYLKKKEAKQLPSKVTEAKEQLQGYLQSEEIKGMEDLKAWTVIFVGDEVGHLEDLTSA